MSTSHTVLKRLIFILLCAAMAASHAEADLQFELMLDKHLSAMSGAQFLDSSLAVYQTVRDKVLPDTLGQHPFINGVYRGTRVLLEDYLARFTMVAQHEIFGHGARVRALHGQVIGYYVSPTHGWTRFYIPANLPTGLQASITAGGVEGTRVLASLWRRRFVQAQSLKPTEGHFYLWSALDQTDYTLRTFKRSTRGDIARYISTINGLHQGSVLSLKKLKTLSLSDFADPYIYYSLASLWQYLQDGSHQYNYPMLNFGDYHYLAGLGLLLAPYGPELQLWQMLRTPQHDWELTLRQGSTHQLKTWGLGLQTDVWQIKNQAVRLQAELWSQPLLDKANFTPKTQLGGLIGLGFEHNLFNNCYFLSEVSYKTQGFTLSQAQRAGFGLRVGLKIAA